MYFDHFISPSLLELPQFRTITYNPDDISALKHLSDDELFDLYYLFYDTDPVQDDRGYLIRQIYTANINPIEPLQRPPIDNLGHSLNCKPSICHPIPFPIPRIDTAYHRFTIPYVAGSGAYAWLTCDCFYLDRSQIPLMSTITCREKSRQSDKRWQNLLMRLQKKSLSPETQQRA